MASATLADLSTQAPPRFPMKREPLSPPAEFRDFQQQPGLVPVQMWNGKRAWLATRYEDVRSLLADNRFSANPATEGFPTISEGRASLVYSEEPSFIRMDPPDHSHLRRMLTSEFTLNRVAAMRVKTEFLVEKLIDEMLAGPKPVDFVKAFSLALPATIMSGILGVPTEDQPFFEDCGNRITDFSLPAGESLRAAEQFRAYIYTMIENKTASLDEHDDLISRLIRNYVQPGELSVDEAVRTVQLLILAGTETTAHSISLSTILLLRDRESFDALRDNEDPVFTRAAVEEMLRYTSVVQYMCARVALEDVDYKGHLIRKGEGILPMLPQANRDPSRFSDAEKLNIFRKEKVPHVAFGFGVHQCLGQALARLEMEVAFDRLPKRIPTLRLAGELSDVTFKGDSITHGVHDMMVTW